MEYVLFIFIYAGALSADDSMTSYSIPNFRSAAACQQQGKNLEGITAGTTKVLKFKCIPVG